ncbi:MAG: sulfurtransferase TusA family protein [Nitrososphaerales archaeon]
MDSQLEEQKIVQGSRELAELLPTKKIDTRGLVCPYPAFETARVAASATLDDVIEVLTDDKYVALNSLPTVFRLRAFDFVIIKTPELFILKAKRQN